MNKLPILYKKTSTGKIQRWEIFVKEVEEGYSVVTKRGYIDGKIQEDKGILVTEGKNLGKSNETTPLYQAEFMCQSKWKKKKDEGYMESIEEAESNVVVLPMLADKFKDKKKHVVYPCFVQPKLDGCRSITRMRIDTIDIISRGGKEYSFLEHIREELKDIFSGTPEGFYLDGELYSEELTLQEIGKIIKKTKTRVPDDVMHQIEYHVYDCFTLDNLNLPYEVRLDMINNMVGDGYNYIKPVLTEEANSEEEVEVYHGKYVEQGYEGVIIRNKNLKYELDNRSKELLKLKSFLDDEYPIVGVEEATGNDAGTAIFVCYCKKTDKTFNCRPKGKRPQRKEWFENFDKYKGKLLTVEFFDYTDDGLPHFGVGKAIRDYEQ